MSTRYDEKGKIFTSVVSKEAVSVILQTLLHRIEGNMYVRQEERVKDALERKERYLAITDATVFNSQGVQIYQAGFMVVNCDQIVWLIPNDEDDEYQEE